MSEEKKGAPKKRSSLLLITPRMFQAFNVMDSNADHKIAPKEFARAAKALLPNIKFDSKIESDIAATFSRFDTDKDGFISMQEFAVFMNAFDQEGSKPTRVFNTFLAVDKDKDGKISKDEFGAALKELQFSRFDQKEDSDIYDLFTAMDRDKDGKVTMAEFCAIVKTLWAEGGRPRVIVDVFNMLDTGKSGKLDLAGFGKALRALGYHRFETEKDADLKALFNSFDSDDDGFLTLSEASMCIREMYEQGGRPKEMVDAFNSVDADHDGKITLNEYAEALHKLKFPRHDVKADADIRALFHEFDRDVDEAITLDEFARLVKSLDEQGGRPKNYVDAFNAVDSSKKGRINRDEMSKALKDMHFVRWDLKKEKDLADLFTYNDRDADGLLSISEFCKILKLLDDTIHRSRLLKRERQYKLAFDMVDKDHNGAITFNEFKDALQNLEFKGQQHYTEEETRRLFKDFDMNGNGSIDFVEFGRLVDSLAFSPEQMQWLREAFLVFDKDRNNHITAEEYGKIVRLMGYNLSEAEIRAQVAEFDLDSNGTLEFWEFVRMHQMREEKKPTKDDEERALRAAFKLIDKNGDGFLTADELRELMTGRGEPLTKEEADRLIKEADRDGNGKIDFDEFSKMMVANL